jgi:hypothetical protein
MTSAGKRGLNLTFVAVAIGIIIAAFLLTSALPTFPTAGAGPLGGGNEAINGTGHDSGNGTSSLNTPPPNNSSLLGNGIGENGTGNGSGNATSPSNTPAPTENGIGGNVTGNGSGNGTSQGSNTNQSNSTNDAFSGLCLCAEGAHTLLETPIFEIQGSTHSSYIRALVGEDYQNGSWNPSSNTPTLQYVGSYIPQEITPCSSKIQSTITITPLVTFSKYIPTVEYTNNLPIATKLQTTFYPTLNIFITQASFNTSYDDQYTHYGFDESLLQTTPLLQTSSIYYQVPSSLKLCLDQILAQIDLSHANTSYDKILAIRNYLQSNYVYDLNYHNAPANIDPVQWFLLTEKRGVCANFNSAFALLLRESGIPARVVTGYAIDSLSDHQIVKAKQAHQWAEVDFQNIGWIEFDATGSQDPSLPNSSPISTGQPQPTPTPTPISTSQPQQTPIPLIKTITNITNLSPSATKGGSFLTQGKVTDLQGNPASDLLVTISLKTKKDDLTSIKGSSGTTAKDGTFKITSQVPANVSVGNYQVIAKTTANNVYAGSESDPILAINTQTQITIAPTNPATINQPFTLYAQLTENLTNQTIANQYLTLTYNDGSQQKSIKATTNQSGYANINFDSIPSAPDNKLNYTVTFLQTGFYLTTTTQGQLILLSNQPNQILAQAASILSSPIFLISITLAIIAASTCCTFLLLRKKKKIPLQNLQPLTGFIPKIEIRPKTDTILKIEFPQIKPPFPDVWGINETLTAQFILTKKDQPIAAEIEVKPQNEPPKKIFTQTNGTASIELKLKTKGITQIIATYSDNGHPVTTMRTLRVVDYIEEIVALFNETFDFSKTKGLRINKDTSPREFQTLMQNTVEVKDNSAVESLVSIFEVADYSLYSLGRTDYERMFLASYSIKQQSTTNQRYDG